MSGQLWVSELEDALGDSPDLAVVRKNRASSGLIRYDSRSEREDWVQVIRETIAATKPRLQKLISVRLSLVAARSLHILLAKLTFKNTLAD